MKTIKLTNEEKIKVYRAAMRHMKTDINPFSMCYSIHKAYDRIYDAYADLRRMFPEFEALRPTEIRKNNFWWDRKNKGIRMRMFRKLIKDLEAKTSPVKKARVKSTNVPTL